MEQLEAKLEDTNRRLSQLSQQIAETQGDLLRLRSGRRPSVPAAPARGACLRPDVAALGNHGGTPGRRRRVAAAPAELYDTAYADYTKGRYALAVQGFQEYLDDLSLDRPLRQRASTGSASRTSRRRSTRKRSPTSRGF